MRGFICLAILAASSAEYFKVASETCNQLNTTSNFFDSFLLPCAEYKSDDVEFKCLTSAEEAAAVGTVPDWTLVKNAETGDSIKRTFKFDDFQHAFLFMAETAQLAEKNGHHPDWRNLWNQVDVTLTTDDKLCLSSFDIELAQGMDYLYNQLKK